MKCGSVLGAGILGRDMDVERLTGMSMEATVVFILWELCPEKKR